MSNIASNGKRVELKYSIYKYRTLYEGSCVLRNAAEVLNDESIVHDSVYDDILYSFGSHHITKPVEDMIFYKCGNILVNPIIICSSPGLMSPANKFQDDVFIPKYLTRRVIKGICQISKENRDKKIVYLLGVTNKGVFHRCSIVSFIDNNGGNVFHLVDSNDQYSVRFTSHLKFADYILKRYPQVAEISMLMNIKKPEEIMDFSNRLLNFK